MIVELGDMGSKRSPNDDVQPGDGIGTTNGDNVPGAKRWFEDEDKVAVSISMPPLSAFRRVGVCKGCKSVLLLPVLVRGRERVDRDGTLRTPVVKCSTSRIEIKQESGIRCAGTGS